MTDLLVVKV